jgi:hypothetical protein
MPFDYTNIVILGKEEIKLDPTPLRFNEATLSNYLETEGSWYDYFGAKLADAEYFMQKYELEYDVAYSEKFKENKENGASDKLAEAQAKCDPDVETAKNVFLSAKHNVRLLQQHLRAWDKNHDNAMSRGHFLRKEMDKLSPNVYTSRMDTFIERRIEDVVKDAETQLESNE